VRNEAFADHWGSTAVSEETWRRGHTGARAFRPDLFFLALADAAEHAARPQVAAIVLAHHYEADTAVTGRREAWISTIGTRRAWRRRGVATALIGAALGEAKRQASRGPPSVSTPTALPARSASIAPPASLWSSGTADTCASSEVAQWVGNATAVDRLSAR
jgi:GNAT superfamily N-acetyltransferase